jgi:hypothetical protein
VTADGTVGRILGHTPLLDLSGLSSPDDLAGIAAIESVATVVVPRSLAAAYTAIPTSRVANTVFVPDGAKVRSQTGSLSVAGDELGDENDVLIVVGMLLITSPITGSLPGLIHVTGSVLAPRGSESKIGKVLEGTGSVVQYRWAEDQDINVMSGQLRISAASLANSAGTAADVLILAGQAVLTGTVNEVGYRQILTAGQAAFPESARDQVEPRLVSQGQLAWYRSEQPRVFNDATTVTAAFLQLLDEKVSIIAFGDLTVAEDVTSDLLRAKVSDLVLFGDATAPADVVPTLQFLATDAYGSIRSAGAAD